MSENTHTHNHVKQCLNGEKWTAMDKKKQGEREEWIKQKLGKEQQHPMKNNLKSDLTETPAKDMSLVTKNECVKMKATKQKQRKRKKHFVCDWWRSLADHEYGNRNQIHPNKIDRLKKCNKYTHQSTNRSILTLCIVVIHW